jgi:nicotinamide-nucleotide amidase
VTAYSNEAKVALVDVPAELIERFGAVSEEVGRTLARGAVERFGASFGIGITGIAGPDGGTEEKPVGTVCVCVAGADGSTVIERRVKIPGDRAAVRDRTTTLAMHLLRRALLEGRQASPTAA